MLYNAMRLYFRHYILYITLLKIPLRSIRYSSLDYTLLYCVATLPSSTIAAVVLINPKRPLPHTCRFFWSLLPSPNSSFHLRKSARLPSVSEEDGVISFSACVKLWRRSTRATAGVSGDVDGPFSAGLAVSGGDFSFSRDSETASLSVSGPLVEVSEAESDEGVPGRTNSEFAAEVCCVP